MSFTQSLRLPGEREPCPICQIVDCVGHPANTAARLGKVQFEEWGDEVPRRKEPVMASGDVTLTEKVYERRPRPGRSKGTVKVLVGRAGAVISKERAKELNVSADGTQSSVPEVGPAVIQAPESAATPAVPEGAMVMAEGVTPSSTPRRREMAKRTTKKAAARKTTAKKATAKKTAKRATKARKAAKKG